MTDVSSKAQATAMHINYSAELAKVKGAPPQYFIAGKAAPGQIAVFGSEPGEPDYNPLWEELIVTWKPGVTPVLLKQDDQINGLAKQGKLTVKDVARRDQRPDHERRDVELEERGHRGEPGRFPRRRHRRSRSATACAARPSPRPVKPRPSVVVARTFTSPSPDRLLEPPPHLVAVRSDPRLLADEHAVGVHEPPAGSPNLRVGDPEQLDRGDAAVALLTGGEEPADVAEPGGPEQRVDQRMRDHVSVGMAGEPARVVDLDPAQDERDAFDEPVGVVPGTDADVGHGGRLLRPGGNERLDPSKVVGRRHLQEPLVAGNDLDPAAGRLDERGAVGALPRGRRPQHRGHERLRGLHCDELVARQASRPRPRRERA